MDARPYLLGLAGAVLVALTVGLWERLLASPRHGRRASCVLFTIGAIGFAGGLLIEPELPYRVCYGLISVVSAYAFVGTLREWPGFRPPPEPAEEGADEV